MKIIPLTLYKPYVQMHNRPKVLASAPQVNQSTNSLLYNPKSYISFGQPYNDNKQDFWIANSYGYNTDDDQMPIAQKRELERLTKEMQDKNDYLWALSWDKEKAKKEYEQKAENYIKTRTAGIFSYMSESNKRYWKNYFYGQYYKELSFYNKIMSDEDYYKNLLSRDIHSRLRSASEIMQNTKGKLNDNFAGYNDFKTQMNGSFIMPLTQELLDGGEQEVFNGLLLYGPTGCGKTLAAETLAHETYCTVDSIGTDTDPDDFRKKIHNKLEESKARYYQKQQQLNELRNSREYQEMTREQKDEALKKIGSPRTVVIIDEFDRYFNPLTCQEEVIQKNTDAIKLMFDSCSKLPNAKEPAASAVTFICTTNYPERIPFGEINIQKLTPFALLPPHNKDFEDVVRHYLKYANELIKEYQKTTPNLELVDIENIKLEKFSERFSPDLEQGAISNDAIRYNVIKAAKDYIDDPKYDFNIYLLRTFKNNIRDIRPEKLQKYKEQFEKMDRLIDKSNNDKLPSIEQVEERIFDLEQYEINGVINDDEKEELQALYKIREELKNEGN